ncbi:MAG: hypothetical protein ACP5L0_07870, partial [Caldisphaera sp.]|uniref:hypothetical protein n=1 Tax=Caldisphaera sp. TaxID=2060322 RepID=UPI003D0E0537
YIQIMVSTLVTMIFIYQKRWTNLYRYRDIIQNGVHRHHRSRKIILINIDLKTIPRYIILLIKMDTQLLLPMLKAIKNINRQ